MGMSGLVAGCIAAIFSATTTAESLEGQKRSYSANFHNQVHRVSHALANAADYQRSGVSGYKWGNKLPPSQSDVNWLKSTDTASGYKWGKGSNLNNSSSTYAENLEYKWGLRSFSDQAGYKWGLRGFSDQAGYKWGLRSSANQTGYKWGLR